MFKHALLALAMTGAALSAAQAAEFKKFDRAEFTAAQAAGKPALIDVAAWWCPVCKSQSNTIKAAVTDAKYNNLTIYRLDYDKHPEEWKAFGATKQATLIAFKGKQETGRLAYKTDKAEINALLASTVR